MSYQSTVENFYYIKMPKIKVPKVSIPKDIKNIGNDIKKVGNDIGKGTVEFGKDIEKGAVDVGNDIKKGAVDVGKDIEKGFNKEIINPTKGAFNKVGKLLKNPFGDIWSILQSVGIICCAILILVFIVKAGMVFL
jgi:hypothetical protein